MKAETSERSGPQGPQAEPEHPWLVPRRKMMSRKLDASTPFTGFFDFGAYDPFAQNDGTC